MPEQKYHHNFPDSRTQHKHTQIKELGRMESELRSLNKQFVCLKMSPSDQKLVESKMDSTIDSYRKLVREVEQEEKSEGFEYVP